GWPARLVTASRDGYRWEHALAELWSNQFNKWFLVDTDYNIFYMADDKPLSAYELCHTGPSLQKSGKLQVKQLAPLKQGIKMQNLLPYYRYVHIDLRNDWYSRKLKKGSPAGGDLATWWTARPDLDRLLTVKLREENAERFDWHINGVSIYPSNVVRESDSDDYSIKITLSGYSPYFEKFQVILDDEGWQDLESNSLKLKVKSGQHCFAARMMTLSGFSGSESTICYQYK
ncbi:MAG: hypothetical protein U9R57_10920, partial [Thermodesulfobacteriota bacterium]|nr:hypothetical protein [Thermodesulfobacteriota bacterium]